MIAIIGAGFSGAIVARKLAELGKRSIVFESRSHVAGNCHTERQHGIMVHIYGPHIFHTDRQDVWDFVNQYGEFQPFINRVKAVTDHGVFSLPINLLTINQFFGENFSPQEAKSFVESLGNESIDPVTFEDQALRFMGMELYLNFFYGYTKKQWGLEPKELPASILKRLPMRFSYDDNYFTSRYQGIPIHGYTALVENILGHHLIQVQVDSFFDFLSCGKYEHVFWSGSLDSFFNYSLGRLQYRTLDFESFETTGDFQGTAVMNYCQESIPYTRVTEHKHFAPWETHSNTICFREYSRNARPGDTPYYPVRLAKDKRLLEEYLALARQQKNVTFMGRLGTYRYLDMDAVIGETLDLATHFPNSRETWPRFTGPNQ